MLGGYVKNTSNCEGLPLGWDAGIEVLEDLGTHQSAVVITGSGYEDLPRRVVGWTDLFMGRPCPVDAYRVHMPDGNEGMLLCGGNSGLRILADENEPDFRTPGVDDHLPNGWGMPVLFIGDESDFVAFVDDVPEEEV